MPIPHVPSPNKPIGYDVNAATFYFTFYISDTITNYDIQVATGITYASPEWNLSASTYGLPHFNYVPVSIPYAGTALTPGTVYYWRIRGRNGSGVSAWSSSVSFRPASTASDTDCWSDWANTILSKLTDGIPVTALGTIIPEDTQVADLVCAEYRDIFHVVDSYHGEPIDRYVELIGASWSLDADTGWTVDLVTQDVPG